MPHEIEEVRLLLGVLPEILQWQLDRLVDGVGEEPYEILEIELELFGQR